METQLHHTAAEKWINVADIIQHLYMLVGPLAVLVTHAIYVQHAYVGGLCKSKTHHIQHVYAGG